MLKTIENILYNQQIYRFSAYFLFNYVLFCYLLPLANIL